MTETNTYSICIRLRRTTVEDTFVRVLITDELMQSAPDEQGNLHLDPAKITEAAISMGQASGAGWVQESQPVVEMHPLQTAPPKGL